MLRFSIKNAFRKKGTAILASVGVGFGLLLVFVIGAFTAGVSAQFQDNLSKTIGVVEIIEKDVEGRANSHLPLSLPDELYSTPDVGAFITKYNIEIQAPRYYTSNYSGSPPLNNLADTLTLKGLNTTLDQNWGGPSTKLLQGRVFTIGNNEAIIDNRLLDVAQLSVSIGAKITISLDPGQINTTTLTIVGIYEEEDIGAPDFVPREYYIYTDIQTVWTFLALSGEETGKYSSIHLRFNVETTEETESFADLINNYSEGGGYSPTFINAIALSTFFESIEETFAVFDAFAGIIGIITVLAGGMAIIVTQLMSVTARMKEFAILKSTGWKNRHIFLNVIYESLTLGLLGALIGMGIGSILILLLGSGASPFGGASAIVTLEGVLEVIAYALGLGILGGLYPGIKASRVRPVVVLKGE
ncbi:MAG: ABC transporter permease [Promethearchaeota archaeon]